VKVSFTTPARNDLDRIHRYIAKKNPAAAMRVLRAIRQAAERLGEFPLMAPRSDLPKVHVKWAIPYPYLIFYRFRDGEVLVLHVRHAARQPPSRADF
jgi:toxin ParE1/3/4